MLACPLEPGHLPPSAVEGAARRGDRVIDVLDAALRNAGPRLAGIRVEEVECPAVRCVDKQPPM